MSRGGRAEQPLSKWCVLAFLVQEALTWSRWYREDFVLFSKHTGELSRVWTWKDKVRCRWRVETEAKE